MVESNGRIHTYSDAADDYVGLKGISCAEGFVLASAEALEGVIGEGYLGVYKCDEDCDDRGDGGFHLETWKSFVRLVVLDGAAQKKVIDGVLLLVSTPEYCTADQLTSFVKEEP